MIENKHGHGAGTMDITHTVHESQRQDDPPTLEHGDWDKVDRIKTYSTIHVNSNAIGYSASKWETQGNSSVFPNLVDPAACVSNLFGRATPIYNRVGQIRKETLLPA
jgi:hypothetical protein